jgi:hypothetical protein
MSFRMHVALGSGIFELMSNKEITFCTIHFFDCHLVPIVREHLSGADRQLCDWFSKRWPHTRPFVLVFTAVQWCKATGALVDTAVPVLEITFPPRDNVRHQFHVILCGLRDWTAGNVMIGSQIFFGDEFITCILFRLAPFCQRCQLVRRRGHQRRRATDTTGRTFIAHVVVVVVTGHHSGRHGTPTLNKSMSYVVCLLVCL